MLFILQTVMFANETNIRGVVSLSSNDHRARFREGVFATEKRLPAHARPPKSKRCTIKGCDIVNNLSRSMARIQLVDATPNSGVGFNSGEASQPLPRHDYSQALLCFSWTSAAVVAGWKKLGSNYQVMNFKGDHGSTFVSVVIKFIISVSFLNSPQRQYRDLLL